MTVRNKFNLRSYLFIVLVLSANLSFSQIYYVDIPDTTLTYKVHMGYNDSTNNLQLDINGDNIMDVGFESHYSTKFVSASNPNAPQRSMGYNYNTSFTSNIARETGSCTKIFNLNDTIDWTKTWSNTSDIYVSVYMAYFPCGTPYSDKYYGFRFSFGSQIHYGWIRVSETTNFLTIKDFAYNMIPNDPIIAGQISVGIKEQIAEQNNIIASEGKLIIKNRLHNIKTIEVFTVLGSLIKTIKIEGEEVKADMQDVSGSVLIVKATTTEGIIFKKLYLPN